MSAPENPDGIWLQRLWWKLRDLYHQLKPSRFSFLVALISCPVFLYVAQGTEILRVVGEGLATNQSYWPRVFGFFGALLLWALSSWYAARVLLYFDFPSTRRSPTHSKLAETHVPRLLGIAPVVIVGCGFWVAASSYNSTAPAQTWLHCFAGLCALLAIAFYLALILRRRWMRAASSERAHHLTEIGRSTTIAVSLMLVGSLLLFILFAVSPVPVPQALGMGTILFLAAASWISVGSLLVYFGSLWQFPVITLFILLACVFSFWNDNHVIRTVPPQDVARTDVIQSFRSSYKMTEKADGPGVVHPLFIVATEGGGIRAAYWTATVLGALQDANPNFAPHLFAISGVSGGSLGATVFDALLAEPNPGSFKEKANAILGQDFLSPALGSMLYPDFVQRFLPFPVPYFDRGRALELGWEKAWRETMHTNRFAESFVDLWKPGPRPWIPSLLLNGTSVEKGNRIITSNLRLTTAFLDAEDAADRLAQYQLPATQAGCHIPLSTAAHMSARFTFVSPAGRFPDGGHVVDGGYFENSAATTALEIATRIKDWCAFKQIANVDVKVIMISNDPRRGSIAIAPAKPGPEPPGPKLTASVTTEGHFLGELMAPLYALMNTRNARGIYAQKAIKREQRRFQVGTTESPDEIDQAQPATPDIIYFALRDTEVPLPLGWMLSAAAAKTMQDQLHLEDDLVRNETAMNAALASLGAPRLAP